MTTAIIEPPLSRRALFSAARASRRKAWTQVEGLEAASGDVFWAGWADQQSVFVAGDEGTILHFDGIAWQRMPTPVQVPMHALWRHPDGRLFAVGWMGAILVLDGEKWRSERGCLVDDDGRYAANVENTPLFALTGNDAGKLWAVGDNGTILTSAGDGSWSQEISGTAAHLRAIAVLPDGDLFAAGADGTVLLSNGQGDWQAIDCPVRTGFQAIHALAADDFLLAGGRYFVDHNGFRGDLLRYHRGEWPRLEASEPMTRLRALAGYRDGALAVGDRGRIFHIDGDRVTRLESATDHDLMGIVPLSTGEALAVGDFGTVLTAAPDFHAIIAKPNIHGAERPSRWSPMTTGTDRQLWGLWHDPRNACVYACGEEGTVLQLEGDRWEALPPVGAIGLHAICEAEDGGILVAGQLGEVHHFDGQIWRKHFDLLMDVTILSMAAFGPDCIFAAGDEGLVLRWDGQSWERLASGTRSAIYGLWGADADHLLAVGDFGMIQRWNGKRFDEFYGGTENFLFDVWGSALDDIHIVGLSGTIGHFDGHRWTLTPARARSDLLAVAGDGRDAFAVGAAGTVMRRTNGRWNVDPSGFDGGLRAVSIGQNRVLAAGDSGNIFCREA